MYKNIDVVMLPTNEKVADLSGGRLWININKELKISKPNMLCPGSVVYQHLYFLSNEEIKEGDWCLFFWDGGQIGSDCPKQYIPSKGHVLNSGLRKIISSTNSKLIINIGGDTLPQPSPQFIQKYIEEYNKGNVINEVMVEYIDYNSDENYRIDNKYNEIKLKVNSKDNTITIKKIKDSWTREEVIRLLHSLSGEMYKKGIIFNPKSTHDWIKENL